MRHYPTPEKVTARITTIDTEAATDGWYALLTNLPTTITAADVLTRYKNQPGTGERRYHNLKGPLAVAPMFLHTNRRIAVLCFALLTYCLVEREARRKLAPATKLDGLYAGRPAIPHVRITGLARYAVYPTMGPEPQDSLLYTKVLR